MKEIYKQIDYMKNDLIDLSLQIHSNPEIKWEEFEAINSFDEIVF